MWLEENRSQILCDNPDFSDEADIIKEGMIRFRVLSAEERKVRATVLRWELAGFPKFERFLGKWIEYIKKKSLGEEEIRCG